MNGEIDAKKSFAVKFLNVISGGTQHFLNLNYGFNQKRSEKKENRKEMSDIRANTFSPFNAPCDAIMCDWENFQKYSKEKVDLQETREEDDKQQTCIFTLRCIAKLSAINAKC